MKLLFLHGLGVKTAGKKPCFLRDEGYEVIEPQLPHGDFEESVQRAREALGRHEPDVVVGDCRGGAVALAVKEHAAPQVLIAPAWRKWGNERVAKRDTVILHSKRDTVISIDDSRELMRASNVSEACFRVVGRDHFMDDPPALAALRRAIQEVARCNHPAMTPRSSSS